MKNLLLVIILLFSINSFGQWAKSSFYDYFGDKTEKDYIRYTDYNGTFSNSITNGSKLTVDFIVYTIDIYDIFWRFDLHEYKNLRSTVGKAIGDTYYTLYVKLSSGEIKQFSLEADDKYLYMPYTTIKGECEFLTLLSKENKILKCYITVEGEYNNETYNFVINPIGFTKYFKMLGN